MTMTATFAADYLKDESPMVRMNKPYPPRIGRHRHKKTSLFPKLDGRPLPPDRAALDRWLAKRGEPNKSGFDQQPAKGTA